jgi:hypothetical protein
LWRFVDAIVYVYHEAGCVIGMVSDGWNESLGLSRSSWDGFICIKGRAIAELRGIEMRISVFRVS